MIPFYRIDEEEPCDPSLVILYDRYRVEPIRYTIFPNPVNDVLYLELESEAEIVRYELLSASGRVLSASVVDGLSVAIDTRHIASGMFFFRLYDIDGNWKVEKVIKQ